MKIKFLFISLVFLLSVKANLSAFIEFDPPSGNCKLAKIKAIEATLFSKSPYFHAAQNQLQKLANNGNVEYAISFGKKPSGEIIISIPEQGKSNSGKVPEVKGHFADLHNHIGSLPPSSGDVYGFIDRALKDSLYSFRYIITSNKTLYALALINAEEAQKFNESFGRTKSDYFQYTFPDSLFYEYADITERLTGLYHKNRQESNEWAMSFMLEKYRAGLVILKQDAKGEFRKIIAITKKDRKGNMQFEMKFCE